MTSQDPGPKGPGQIKKIKKIKKKLQATSTKRQAPAGQLKVEKKLKKI